MCELPLILPLLFITATTVCASGKFSILEKPNSIEFKGDEKLESDNIPDVIEAALGYTVDENAHWSGLFVKDPFNVPQIGIALLIEGVSHVNLKGKVKSFPMVGDTARESLDLLSLLEEGGELVVDLDLMQGPEALLTYSDILGNITLPSNVKSKGNLKPSLHSEDKLFLHQINMIDGLAKKLSTIERKPAVITMRLSLNPIALTHGESSLAMSEALKLLAEAIETLQTSARDAFKNELLFVVITDRAELNRSKRQADKDKKDVTPDSLNLATEYDEDYPVIFNIILWFGVVFAFSLLAISYFIATMDPGRDSIIYRMTSTRMKKDN